MCTHSLKRDSAILILHRIRKQTILTRNYNFLSALSAETKFLPRVGYVVGVLLSFWPNTGNLRAIMPSLRWQVWLISGQQLWCHLRNHDSWAIQPIRTSSVCESRKEGFGKVDLISKSASHTLPVALSPMNHSRWKLHKAYIFKK